MRTPSRRLALAATTLALGLVGATAPLLAADDPGELPDAVQERAMRACVRLETRVDALPGVAMTGSGTIVDGDGFVITNFHCVGRRKGDDRPEMILAGLAVGDYYAAGRRTVVSLSDSWSKPPKPTYWARVVEGDPAIDLAVLKIVSPFSDTKQPLPATLPVQTIALGDSEPPRMRAGSWVYVLGYPGVGGATITFTDGKVAGFLDEDDLPPTDWLKTTATINPGNSGGSAIDRAGKLVGVPTEKRGEAGDTLNYLRAVAHAAPLLERARRSWRTRLAEGGGETTPVPPAGPPTLSGLRFGSGWVEGTGATGVAAAFPAGTKQVWAGFRYANLRNGMRWRYEWTRDGRPDVSRKDLVWDRGSSGVYGVGIQNEEGVIPGRYVLRVHFDDRLLLEGTTTVEAGPAVPPAPAPARAERATLVGRVRDLATGKPIAGAVVIVLKEGRRVVDWLGEAGLFGGTVLAHGTSDVDGEFVLPDAIPRGPTYAMIVMATGYQSATSDAALDSTREGTLGIEAKLEREE